MCDSGRCARQSQAGDGAGERANNVILLRRTSAIATLCGFFDRDSHSFMYATADHSGPYVTDGCDVRVLSGGGLPLGILAGATYPEHEVTLQHELLAMLNLGPREEAERFEADDPLLIDAVRRTVHGVEPQLEELVR